VSVDATAARFPDVGRRAGFYESFYLRACDPGARRGVWIRHTVHKRPGEAPQGSLWFTLFDGGKPSAVKETMADVGAGEDEYIHVGESKLGFGTATGSAEGEGRSASWDLTFESGEEPFFHLPRDWMYRAPVPKTKLLSPYPDARFSGRAKFGDREVVLDGWRGMIGHNWGAQHAERWIWTHGADFEEDPSAWFDGALGRIKLGPVTTPWIANAVLFLNGERHRLGGPEKARRTEVEERPDGATFTLPGDGITVQGTVGADRDAFVGWVYADPDGSEHHTVNCSASDMTLTVSKPGEGARTLTVAGGAAYELGMREQDHGMEIQPFGDG
jgi:hypothetical protein